MAHLITCSLVLLWLRWINGVTQGSFLECIPVLTVPRNTVWRAAPMNTLKINCNVSIPSHCWENLALSWCKVDDGNDCKPLNHSSHITTEWRKITGEYKTSFLVFRNLSTADSGLYRCKVDGRVSTISHNINVTVTDWVTPTGNMDSDVQRNQSTANGSIRDSVDWSLLWPYGYICGGILLVVATLMLGSVLIIRCQRPKKSKKERIAENQSTATQASYIPQPINDTISYRHDNTHSLPPQLSPSCIYDIPRARASSHRDRPSAGRRPANQVAPGQMHDQNNVNAEEEDSPLIYASLNHKTLLHGPIKVSHSEMENSEYAAIKIN
ncbi:uncharacterized protein LOC113577655 [Electrophorus electricus]|uniref:Ig-like domain-containing protein n=1 Tax=Electrophorus electricus TaxID=8005 RepID=A0A4W4FUR7_ELEEL|nr:uncharacterized protein LOC113577655 [Electrophorus electricus]